MLAANTMQQSSPMHPHSQMNPCHLVCNQPLISNLLSSLESSTSHPSKSVEINQQSMLQPFCCPSTEAEWAEADQFLASVVVPAVLISPTIEAKSQLLSNGIYYYFSNRFGVRKIKIKGCSKRQRKQKRSIAKIREERNSLRKELRRAKKCGDCPEMIKCLAVKFHHLVREFSRSKRDEEKAAAKKSSKQARKQCAEDINKFAKDLFEGKNHNQKVKPDFDEQQAQSFFQKIYSSDTREFHRPSWIPQPPPPDFSFDEGEIRQDELERVIRKVRVKSAPSPLDQVPYKVIRHCPSLQPALLHLFNLCWLEQKVPSSWKKAVIRLIPKQAAEEDSTNPANFRPIALTACIGKLFTSIMRSRWLSFMVANRYLDITVQKAFLPGVSGCVEHHQKLLACLKDAHSHHRSLTVCWLDLENAFGSVRHNLIAFSLCHYHAPQIFQRMVGDLYSGLTAIISSKEWCTDAIPLDLGVYQGDPLSPIIFNTVMSTLSDSLRIRPNCGYSLSKSSRSISALLYADDICLLANGPSGAQLQLSLVERWLKWSGMKAKIAKCSSLAVEASTAKRFNPTLFLGEELIPYVGEGTVKFLGVPVSVPINKKSMQIQIQEKLQHMLVKVDESNVTRKQKLLLYKVGICSRLCWDLMVSEFPISWVTNILEGAGTRYLKRWSGLTQSADTSCLYLPRQEGGLGLLPISLMYKSLKASLNALLLTSKDRVICQVVSRVVKHEEKLVRSSFRPALFGREVMDPNDTGQKLARRAKNILASEDAAARREHAESLSSQGELLRVREYASDIWSAAVISLSPECSGCVMQENM